MEKKKYYKHKFNLLSLSDKVVKNREFENCVFQKCSFINVIFKNCSFIKCAFKETRLSAIKPKDSCVIDISFNDSKVEGFDFTIASEVRNINFENCILKFSNFSMLKLNKIKILNSDVTECAFKETDLRESRLTKNDFEGSLFFKCDLKKADFTDSVNYWIDIRECNVDKAKFNLPGAIGLLRAVGIKI